MSRAAGDDVLFPHAPLRVSLPRATEDLDQDEEWFWVERGGESERIGMHDYARIYSIPGLYERVVYDLLQCSSPQTVRRLLEEQWRVAGVDPEGLKVLDLGAGNGWMASELAKTGVHRFVGVDIVPEAAESAHRDRPGLYEDYVIGDVTDLPPSDRRVLDGHRFDCLVCVAALGFGDIPPEAFAAAYNRIEDDGWIGFTIKSDFLERDDDTGFAGMMAAVVRREILDLQAKEEYVHRLSLGGEPLHYTGIVGRKAGSIPRELLEELGTTGARTSP